MLFNSFCELNTQILDGKFTDNNLPIESLPTCNSLKGHFTDSFLQWVVYCIFRFFNSSCEVNTQIIDGKFTDNNKPIESLTIFNSFKGYFTGFLLLVVSCIFLYIFHAF